MAGEPRGWQARRGASPETGLRVGWHDRSVRELGDESRGSTRASAEEALTRERYDRDRTFALPRRQALADERVVPEQPCVANA